MSLLPKLSKRAEEKVKDRLPIPETCPHCGSQVRFVSNEEIYGRAYGDWPWTYLCQGVGCAAYVGSHPQTNIPLGTLATKPIRDARKAAKALFIRLYENGGMTRTQAYHLLADRMGIAVAACHFGWFDVAQCEKAKKVLTDYAHSAPPPGGSVKAFAQLRALLAKAPA